MRQQRASPAGCAPAGRRLCRRLQVHAALTHKLTVKVSHPIYAPPWSTASASPSLSLTLHDLVSCDVIQQVLHGRLKQ